MANSRNWTVGLGLALLSGGIALAETPTMRSILRRPAPSAPGSELAQNPGERKPTSPTADTQVPGLSIDFSGATSTPAPAPLPATGTVARNGDANAAATRRIFDAPKLPAVDVKAEVAQDQEKPKSNSPPNTNPNSAGGQPRANQPQNLPPNANQPRTDGGMIQRWRMRRGANVKPQLPAKPAGRTEQAVAQNDGSPSILDIEMPADAVIQPEPRNAKVASPVNFPVPQNNGGPKPLFSTR